MSIDANHDVMKARRRFCFSTAVDFDSGADRVIVAESQRNRLQRYGKVRDYDAETKDGA